MGKSGFSWSNREFWMDVLAQEILTEKAIYFCQSLLPQKAKQDSEEKHKMNLSTMHRKKLKPEEISWNRCLQVTPVKMKEKGTCSYMIIQFFLCWNCHQWAISIHTFS